AGKDGLANLAISDLRSSPTVHTTKAVVTVTVRNHGPSEAKDVPVVLSVGRARERKGEEPLEVKEVGRKVVSVPAGEAVTVDFAFTFPKAGDYAVQARLPEDALMVDNVRSIRVRVQEALSALVVNGKAAREEFDRPGGFLALALAPTRGTSPEEARVRSVSAAELADDSLVKLTDYSCVFLCDLPRPDAALVRRLDAYLRTGGGLVLFLGPGVEVEQYNRLFHQDGKGLLPVKLFGGK